RPVAVPAAAAAMSAVQEGADALVIDIANEHSVVIEGQDLTAVAAGWQLVEVDGEFGWLRPQE
ncbi:MAG TPA: SseB family protein, partial [Nocardioides sp.]